MKMNLSKNNIKKLIELLSVRETNMNVSEMYLYYLMEQSTSINKGKVDFYLRKGLPLEKAYYRAFLDVMELDPRDEELKNVEETCHIQNMKKLDAAKYMNNPYYRNIKVPQIKNGKWNFQYDSFRPYEGFMYDDLKINENHLFEEYSSFGFFTEPFRYLTVAQGDEIWMSITPHEIETMEPSIQEAHGKVTVFGLGLGYYPYMISLKDNVSEITIIEIDEHAIDLFNEYILPQFEHKEKIRIVHADAYAFAKEMKGFDYAFVDLWHNVDDGVPMYLKMKALEDNSKGTEFSYWIEDSLITMLRRNLLTVLDEAADGAAKENYMQEENYDDHIINAMFFHYENKVINNYEDILQLLSKESIKELAKHLK